MRHVSRVNQGVIFYCLYGCHFIEDHFVALCAVLQAEVDRVNAIVSVQAQSFMACVVSDCERGEQLRFCPFELQMLEVQTVVLVEWFFEGFIDGSNILS